MTSSSAWSPAAIAHTIKYWGLAEKEQIALKRLQSLLSDISHWKNSPEDVVRYLVARSGNAKDAERMFREMIAWRHDNNVDSILEEYQPPDLLLDHFPGAILQGRDRQGDPVFVGRSGVTDMASLLDRFGHEEMVQHAIWLRECLTKGPWIQEYEREQGRPVKRVTLVEDMHGLSRKQLSLKVLTVFGEIMRLDQDNYCEMSKTIIIIRAPTIFVWAWTLAKHFFDPLVVQKMVFCGTRNYKQILAEHVELSILPGCILPEGKGQVAVSMSSKFEGGPLPPKEKGILNTRSPKLANCKMRPSPAVLAAKSIYCGTF